MMKGRPLISLLLALSLCLMLAAAYAEPRGKMVKRPRPHDYGTMVFDERASSLHVPPVVFAHWLHRAKYTCRVCHVDVGFGMRKGRAGVSCQDIRDGMYCGACHNGTEAFGRIEETPEGNVYHCKRCHNHNTKKELGRTFNAFRKRLPKERFGNGIDWMRAEEEGLITLKDYLEGLSLRPKKETQKKVIQIASRREEIPDIIFSHEKHTVWNGCEVCHPAIFGRKKRDAVYAMEDIFNGRYCGVCHGLVAFPNQDCQRCHTKEVY
jgi:c(7)-type cytochrome triheme protein